MTVKELSRPAYSSTAKRVFYCALCYAPVADSPECREGHKERLGHWPEEKKA